ncbi:MAG: amidohydrolase family protein [Pseudonocardia sp.]|nr:amidohydrolase family protein [Pseudonocardia sp.]
MHTLGSAEALGVADRIGSLEVGTYADAVWWTTATRPPVNHRLLNRTIDNYQPDG